MDTARVDRLPRAHKGPARDAPRRPVQILAVMGLSRDVLFFCVCFCVCVSLSLSPCVCFVRLSLTHTVRVCRLANCAALVAALEEGGEDTDERWVRGE